MDTQTTTAVPRLTDKEITEIIQSPWYIELLLLNTICPDMIRDNPQCMDDMETQSIPLIERIVTRYEEERNALSPLLVRFGYWLLRYFIPSKEVFTAYPKLETLYQIMRDRLPADLVSVHEQGT